MMPVAIVLAAITIVQSPTILGQRAAAGKLSTLLADLAPPYRRN